MSFAGGAVKAVSNGIRAGVQGISQGTKRVGQAVVAPFSRGGAKQADEAVKGGAKHADDAVKGGAKQVDDVAEGATKNRGIRGRYVDKEGNVKYSNVLTDGGVLAFAGYTIYSLYATITGLNNAYAPVQPIGSGTGQDPASLIGSPQGMMSGLSLCLCCCCCCLCIVLLLALAAE